MQASVVVNTTHTRHQHVVVLTRHEMTTHNFAAAPYCSLKRPQHCCGLPLQRDADVDGDVFAKEAIVHHGPIAANQSGIFKRLNAPRCRGCRKPCSLADFKVGGSAIPLQKAQDGRIEVVEGAREVIFG